MYNGVFYKAGPSNFKLLSHVEKYLVAMLPETEVNADEIAASRFMKAKLSLKVLKENVDPSYGSLSEQLYDVLNFIDRQLSGKADRRSREQCEKMLAMICEIRQALYPTSG